jgi:3-hydroxyisobutyrate dehydrogenase
MGSVQATKCLSFLGMGIMGAAMAANLSRKLAVGNLGAASLKVWNRSAGRPGLALAAEAGAQVELDLNRCLAGSDVVFSCLGDEKDVHEVLTTQVAPLLAPSAIVVDFSTIGPSAAKQIEAELAKRQVRFLDAPVTGGDIGARQGTLTIMVGGMRQAFDEVLPYLETMGKTVVFCGPPGSGQALKLANQTLCALNLIGVCEALYMAETLGLAPSMVAEVLENGAGGSWALSNLGRRITANDLKPGFAIKHMLKDLRLVFENLPADRLPGTRLSLELFDRALEALAQQAEGPEGMELGTQAMIKAYSAAPERNSGCHW